LVAPYSSPNTDGINIYGGFDNLLENSVVDNGDDCVSIVPVGEGIDGGNYCFTNPGNIACSGGHAIIRNFTCNGGHGLSIGGIRHGTVTNVTFSNITATGGQAGCTQDGEAGGGCRLKSRPNSTGTVSDIRYRDMIFDNVYWPLQILGHYCPFPCHTPDAPFSTLFTDISFERIHGSSSQRNYLPGSTTSVAQFKCSEYAPCSNITMRAVTLTDKAGRAGQLDCEHVADVNIDNASSPSACA
jgi:polygalacturonase